MEWKALSRVRQLSVQEVSGTCMLCTKERLATKKCHTCGVIVCRLCDPRNGVRVFPTYDNETEIGSDAPKIDTESEEPENQNSDFCELHPSNPICKVNVKPEQNSEANVDSEMPDLTNPEL